MSQGSTSVYQSGQRVSTPGAYEVVGAGYTYNLDECTRREFNVGDIFPDYKGRAVCWHLVRASEIHNDSETESAPKEPGPHTPWN